MIHEFSAKNYGCLKDVALKLAPVHALIGPNDSGKSTILRALQTLVRVAAGPCPDPDSLGLTTTTSLEAIVPGGRYRVELEGGGVVETGWDETQGDGVSYGRAPQSRSTFPKFPKVPSSPDLAKVMDQLRGVRLLRLDPDAIRSWSGLVPDAELDTLLDWRGDQLAGMYTNLRLGKGKAFAEIVERVRQHFPTVNELSVQAVSKGEVALGVELADGTTVDAQHMSEGLLYFLAFAAVPHLSPVSLLLVEEPENGLHPSRIADVVTMMEELANSTGTQVVMATHSPLVINCLKPDQVTVVTRPSTTVGTRLTPIRETPHFEQRSSVYALGELWLSYADGAQEGPLLERAGE